MVHSEVNHRDSKGDKMKSPTVAEVSKITKGMTPKLWGRFVVRPFDVRMGIILKLIRKKGLKKILELIRAFPRPH